MQSHRTLAGPDEVMWVARTFREKQLPCDALIYLGTEFTPSGWNTRNGEFTWKKENFPEPTEDDRRAPRAALQGRAPHRDRRPPDERRRVAIPARPTRRCRADARPDDRWPDDRAVPCYWPYHKPLIRPRRRRLVARSGRRPRRAVAAGAHPHVLGGAAALASQRASVRAAPQRIRRACSATARFCGRATCTRPGRR